MKKLFLDVDEVILSFETKFFAWANRKLGLGDFFSPQKPIRNHIEEFGHVDFSRLDREFVDSEELCDLPPIVNASDFNSLTTAYQTYLVTNLPESVIHKRIKNLEKLNLRYDEIFCAGIHKYGNPDMPFKSDIIKSKSNPGEKIFFLDDLPENCMEVKKNIPEARVFLMAHSTNENQPEETEHWKKIHAWADFCQIVRQA